MASKYLITRNVISLIGADDQRRRGDAGQEGHGYPSRSGSRCGQGHVPAASGRPRADHAVRPREQVQPLPASHPRHWPGVYVYR